MYVWKQAALRECFPLRNQIIIFKVYFGLTLVVSFQYFICPSVTNVTNHDVLNAFHSTSILWVSGAAAVWSPPPLKNSPDICDGKSLNDHQQIKVVLLLFIESKQIKITDIYKCIISDSTKAEAETVLQYVSLPPVDRRHTVCGEQSADFSPNNRSGFFLTVMCTYNFLFTTERNYIKPNKKQHHGETLLIVEENVVVIKS